MLLFCSSFKCTGRVARIFIGVLQKPVKELVRCYLQLLFCDAFARRSRKVPHRFFSGAFIVCIVLSCLRCASDVGFVCSLLFFRCVFLRSVFCACDLLLSDLLSARQATDVRCVSLLVNAFIDDSLLHPYRVSLLRRTAGPS